MMRKVLALASVAVLLEPTVCAVAAPAIAAASAAGESSSIRTIRVSTRGGGNQSIAMGLNKATVVELDSDVKDVLVSSPDIVDAVVKSPRRIFLLAAKVGQTNAFFLDENGRHLLSLDIRVERDTTDLDALMKATMPKSAIKVTAMADNIVLSGNVPSAIEASRAVNLAVGFTGDAKKVVNMLSVAGGDQVMLKVRIAEMDRSIAKQFGINTSAAASVAGVPMVLSNNNPFGLLGHALSDASGGQIGSVCPQQFFPNTSSTSTAQTVTGNSTVSTVTGTPSTETHAGYAYQAVKDAMGNYILDPVTGQAQMIRVPIDSAETIAKTVGSTVQTITSALAPSITSTVTTSSPCSSANNAQGVLNALEQVGLVHILAEPNLSAVSGETGKFNSGGQFPVPTSRDRDGNITLEFKKFGVGLSFTPVVLSSDRISIQLSTEVSQLSSLGAYQLNGGTTTQNGITTTVPGTTIPALQVRQVDTTIEVPTGGSFAIAGLLQHVNKQTIDGFPALKDMPVLGALFRSRDYQNDETELVVIATAYLVEPTAESKLAAPTDGFVPPSDPETLLLGRLNAVYKDKTKPAEASAAAAGPGGFIVQ
jgi:pilus assembly protein CpaC